MRVVPVTEVTGQTVMCQSFMCLFAPKIFGTVFYRWGGYLRSLEEVWEKSGKDFCQTFFQTLI